MMKLHPKLAVTGVLLAVSCLGASCRPQGGLKEAARLQEQAAQRQQATKALQTESEAIGNLGAYDHPAGMQLAQLRDHVQQLREANTQLLAEKKQVTQDLETLKKNQPAAQPGQPR